MIIEDRLLNLKPYATLKGKFPVRLDVNESYLNLPTRITDRFVAELKQVEFNRYPDPYADGLCQAFANYYGVDSGLVVAGNGSDELISLIIQGFLSDRGKVLTLQPDFSMYAFYTWLRQGRIVSYKKRDDYTVDLNGVLALARQERPKIIVFSNPCNPTGGIIGKNEIIDLVKRVDCLVVVDEAYMDFSDQSVLEFVNDYDNLIVLKTLSKLGAAAAIRCGFAVSSLRVTKVLKSIKSVYNLGGLSQIMGRIIYEDGDFLKENRDLILESKNELYTGLVNLTTVLGESFTPMPSYSNFIYIKTEKASDIYSLLLKKGIAIRCFKNRLRINAGSLDENAKLLDALRELE